MNYEPTLIDALRPEQLTSATQRKLPRRRLSRGALAVLVLLRAYVILAIPVVGYAFVHALHVSRHQATSPGGLTGPPGRFRR